MPKQTLAQRLEQIKVARHPYLEFLRNLTPQILLASLAWIFMTMIDFNREYRSNIMPILGFITFFGAFIAAFVANSTLFYKEVFAELYEWRALVGRISRKA